MDRGADRVCLLEPTAAGGLANPSLEQSFDTGAEPIRAVASDFNGDGFTDLAILNQGDASVTILLNNRAGGFTRMPSLDVGMKPTDMVLSDVDQDGSPDLLISNESGDLLVLRGRGDGTFAPYQRANQIVTLAVGDLNNDGKTDYVLTNQAQDQFSVSLPGQNTVFQQGRADGLLAPADVQIADLNGDGKPDLIVANSGGNNILVYYGLGGGTFSTPESIYAGTNPQSVTVAPVSPGGQMACFVANSGSNDVSVLLANQGPDGATITQGPRLRVGEQPVWTSLVSVEPDQPPYLLVVNQGDNTVSLLKGLGSGFFDDRSPIVLHTGRTPIRAFVGEFDSSPGLDMVIVNQLSNDLTFYSNFLAGRLHLSGSLPGASSPSPPRAAISMETAIRTWSSRRSGTPSSACSWEVWGARPSPRASP